MNNTSGAISEKIKLINHVVLSSMLEDDNSTLIKNFTEVGIEVLEADFGFAWWKIDGKYQLVYKSLNTPYMPSLPKKRNSLGFSNKEMDYIYDSNVKKGEYESNIDEYLKSYIAIPVHYVEHAYGSIILCYKNPHNFTKEELTLSDTIGNSAAQALTIRWLIEGERENVSLAEKSKETEVLLEQEKLKTEFTNNATHEFGTPLAIMKGNIDLALSGKESIKSYKSALKAVNKEVKILSDILKELVLLTSPKKNIYDTINLTSVNILSVIDKVAKRLQAVASRKKIKILVKPGKNKNLFVTGDKKYLEKLFLNLIKNAITYGRENGKIIISTEKEKETIKIQVSDNGIGISEEDLPKIFERFYRADKARTSYNKSYGSRTGLGLPIAKWITEYHKGTITAESVHGKGSTFTVKLPSQK